MATTSFAYGRNFTTADQWGYDDREHDDCMTADDYDARRYERDGWGDARYDRQRW